MKSTKAAFRTVDEYIGSFPPGIRTKLEALRKTIRNAAPKAEEMIAYGMPAYKQGGPVAYFAAYKKHIGLYPRPGGFEKELSNYECSKGTIKFPIDEPIPLKLVAEMVKHQVIKNSQK